MYSRKIVCAASSALCTISLVLNFHMDCISLIVHVLFHIILNTTFMWPTKSLCARLHVYTQTAGGVLAGHLLEKRKLGAVLTNSIRRFRQNTARQEINSLKEKECLLEKQVKKELLNTPQNTIPGPTSASSGKHKDIPVKRSSPSWLSWLFLAYLYFAIFLVKPKLDFLAGVPWWSVSPDIVAVWILYNLTLSSAEKSQLKEGYESYSRDHPHTCFIDFLNQKHSGIFDGIDVRQREIIAALGACYAFTGDMQFIKALRKHGKSTQPRPNRIENMMNHLISAYPQVFAH
ncbi:cyclin-dependent kinase regulatory subunit [Perkinsela sp. CCAP 1560/4]|nr:cyclin-dependent kinase regulatory subunit [Perkinsela sp. CCAP 1560/4]|eukprot:KNH04717.1 cyclin-dependent kinase regulatory subunit [Perkinsela sp. CCAP 1560/4]